MANQETNMKNWAETTLTSEFGPTALTAVVSTTTALPASPCYLIIEPDSPTQREVILFDGTFTSTNLVTTVIGNRYLAGSAAGSGLTHPVDSVVRHAPVAQHFEDINDRMDIAVDHGAMTGLSDDDHPQYIKDAEYTAKGDLLAGTGTSTFAKITAGANGTVLTADSTDSEGMVWQALDPMAYGWWKYPWDTPASGDFVVPYLGLMELAVSSSFPTTANRVIYTPFISSHDISVDNIHVKLTSSAFPTNLRVGLYTDSGGQPNTLVTNSAGEKTTSWTGSAWNAVATGAAISLSANTWYWVAVCPNNAAAISAINHAPTGDTGTFPWRTSTSNADYAFAGQTAIANTFPAFQQDITYSSGLPATATPVAHTLGQYTCAVGALEIT